MSPNPTGGIIPEEIVGAYSVTPGLDLGSQQTGILDLIQNSSAGMPSTIQSSVPEIDPVESRLNRFINKPTSLDTYSAPKYFDYDRSGAARYVDSPNFRELGFDPFGGVENEYKYGARQTWGDVWSNGLTGMFKLAGNTFIEGWKGWGNLADALFTWDSSKLVGTEEELMKQDKATREIMDKYAIYATPESEQGIFNRKFFGDMLQQSGFSVGTIGQFLSEELLTFGLSTQFSLAKLGLKQASLMGKTITKADVAEDLVKLGNPVWTSRTIADNLVQGARKYVPLAGTAYDVYRYKKAGAGAAQIASIMAGGLRRSLSEVNMAMTEARMEAASTYGELYNKFFDEHMYATGEAPDAERMNQMMSAAKDAAHDNFMVNTGILMLSNRLQFDNLFNRFGSARQVFGTAGQYADDVLKVTAKSAKGAGEKTTKAYVKTGLGTLGLVGRISQDFGKRTAAWEATKSLGKNLFKWEASEGVQELLQEGSNTALSNYYYDLYHGVKGADFTPYAEKAMEDQANIQGLKTFLMGALTGRLLSPINYTVGKIQRYAGSTSEERTVRKKDLAESVAAVNAFYENPNLFLNEHIANVKVQDKAAKTMEEAIKNRDQYEYTNFKDGAFARMMSAAIKTDMFKAVTSTIRQYGDAFNEEEFKQAFGMDKNEENISSVKEYFNKIADETEAFHKNWKNLKEKYGDMVLVDIYQEGTPARAMALRAKRALDDALEILATNNYKATRAAERAVKLQTEMAAIPALGSTVASAFRTLGVIDNTKKEVEILEAEIKNLESVSPKDDSVKEKIKSKKEQLKSLENWIDTYEALKQKGVKEKRKFKKAIQAFEKYVKSKNAESGINVEVKLDQMTEVYEKLIDYMELNKDHKDYIDAYNIVANPMKFVEVHKRLLTAMDIAAEKLKTEHLNEVLNAITNQQAGGTQPPAANQPPTSGAAPGTSNDDQGKPSLMEYLKLSYENMLNNGQTSLPFEDWLKTPTANLLVDLYNKQYGTSESLQIATPDNSADVAALKKEIENVTEFGESFIDRVFTELSRISQISLEDLEKAFDDYQKTLNPDEVEKDLRDMGAVEKMPQDDLSVLFSKYILPKFIDHVLSKKATVKPSSQSGQSTVTIDPNDNFDIIEPPKPVIKMTPPALKEGEQLIDNGKEGIFIVQTSNGRYMIMNSERTHPLGLSTSVFVLSQDEAYLSRDEMIKQRNENDRKLRSFYTFQGRQVRSGMVITEKSTGREYIIITAGEPNYKKDDKEKKNPYIRAVELRNRKPTKSGVDISNFDAYNIKQKVEALDTGEVIDPEVFRLYRTNELSRIYPHVNRSAGETEAQAQQRLDELYRTTTAEEFAKNVTIKIKENPKPPASVKVSGNKKTNPNLIQNTEKYTIQILYRGTPIGYLTNYNNLQYVDENNNIIDMENLTVNQFMRIFDSQGRDVQKQMYDFKTHYAYSRTVFAALSQFVKPGEEVTISSEDLNKVLSFNIGFGEFDYVDDGVSFEQLKHNTIDGSYYIIDRSRRYGKGFTFNLVEIVRTTLVGDEQRKVSKLVEQARASRDILEQMGRYVGVVKLPNGRIRFVELKTNRVSDDKLNDIINKINERSSITKEKNIELSKNDKNEDIIVRKQVDFNESLNGEISGSIFIAVGKDQKGTYVDIGLNDTGNLELTFHKKVGENNIRRQIYIKGETLTSPVKIKDINDLIEQINKAIEKHDTEYAKTDAHKIGFMFTRESFKESLPDNVGVSGLIKLKSNVSDNVVKNIPLTVRPKSDLPAPPKPPVVETTTSTPTASGGTQNTETDLESLVRDITQGTPAGLDISISETNPPGAASTTTKSDISTSSDRTPFQIAKDRIDSLIKEKQEETVKRRQEKIAAGIRPAVAMIEATDEAAALYDRKIDEAKQNLNDIRNTGRNRVLKVVNKPVFDEKSVINIEEFKKYVNRILGDKVSVYEIDTMADRLKNGQITVGRFLTYLEMLQDGSQSVKGRIEVGSDTGFKYHEAFHAVFRLMLSDAQIDKVIGFAKYEIAKKGIDVKSEMAKMRQLHTIYEDMTDAELEMRFYEEYLADRFEEFKINPVDSKTLPGIRGFFQKLLDFIMSLFKSASKNELENFFREIDRGKYRNSKVRENRFTKPDALSISEPVLKAIQIGVISVEDENGLYKTIPKYLSQQEGDKLASTVASLFHKRVLDGRLKYNKKEILGEIYYDFVTLYDKNGPRREFYLTEIERLLEAGQTSQAEAYRVKLDEMYSIFYDSKNRATLSEAVDIHLRIMGYQQELDEDEYTSMEEEFGTRVTTDNWKETHSIGGFGSLSKALRQYIATTVFPMDKDEFGNTEFVNGEPLIQSVNANLVYNGVLKAVANITDQREFINRLYYLKNEGTETGKFISKFFDDVQLEVNPETGDFVVNNATQAKLFQMVIKGFQQYTVDYIFINKDIRQSQKTSYMMLANRMNDAKTQFSQWQNAYVNVYESQLLKLGSVEEKKAFAKERTMILQDLLNLMDPDTSVSDEQLYKYGIDISNQLKNDLGISMAPLFIKFSIASVKKPDLRSESQRKLVESYFDVQGIDPNGIQQIIKSIQAFENPFAKNIDSLKEEEIVTPGEEANDDVDFADDLGEGGNISRVNALAKGNAIFDETVSSTSYKNAEGELVYSHQLPTFHLVQINSLNDENTRSTLMKDDFVRGNILLESPEFRELMGNFRVERIEGMKSSVLKETEDGDIIEDKTIASNQNKGITYGGFSEREFLISLLELYKYNKQIKGENGSFFTSQHLIRVIEASNTGDTVSLPIIKSVDSDTNDKVKLSKEALDILEKEVIREFDRIRRVRTEVSTGVFLDGEIKGYHYAVDDAGRRDPKKVPRGLKFYKMRNTLGSELASELEDASKDPTFKIEDRKKEIRQAIERYWESQIEEFVQKLDKMGIITITRNEQGEGEVMNNLMDDFIIKGFTLKETVEDEPSGVTRRKSTPDEKKNAKTNLKPGRIRHNVGQILINDFLNTLAINQLLYGDESKAFKDEIDQVKRAKGANGSGPSLESLITAPNLGIDNPFTESHILTFTDPKYKAKFAGGLKDKADAQSYTTVKGRRYTLHGLGELTPQRARVLDKLERGEKLTSDEIFNKDYGLKAMDAMLNAQKLVYFDGPMYIKTSVEMLTKEFTSLLVDEKWVARPGMEELHELRERMEAFETKMDTVTFAAPESASKGRKTNIFDHSVGFKNASDDNFIRQDTKYWRLQLVNPSNKVVITDPTQAKQIIIAEQDDDTKVDFMGVETDIKTLKQLYLRDTDQRIKNNYTRARNEIFDIEEGFEELGKSIRQDKITAKLEKFQKRAIETLRSTGADTQTIEFFSLDEYTGKPKYNLNNPVTLEKYTQLFLAYFSKGVMSEKIPGHSVALMSNFGVKVVKRFTGRFDENGVPIGEVIQRSEVERNPKKYTNAKRWNNDIDREFSDLKTGDFYVDDLRHNVPEYDNKGKIIGRYSEFMMPPHFEEYMRFMNLKPGEKIPDFVAKMFGVRIPSQDKHSFISLKLVDFMPAYYGSTAIFPHELIEISGADFDIDKLYIHVYDTYVKNRKRIPYGTNSKTKEGRFEEFVRWHSDNNKTFKEELKKLKETDPAYQSIIARIGGLKKLEKEIDKLFNSLPSENTLRDNLEAAILASRMVDAASVYAVNQKTIRTAERKGETTPEPITLEEYAERYELVESAHFLKDLQELFDGIDEKEAMSIGIEWYKELKSVVDVIRTKTDVESRLVSQVLRQLKLPHNERELDKSKEELNNGVLNNRILNQKLAFLNNEHLTKGNEKAIAFEVASVAALSNLLDKNVEGNFIDLFEGVDSIQEILQEGGVDTDSMIGKTKSFKNNKEGSTGIGPAVNSMLVYAIMNNFNVNFRDYYVNQMGEKVEMYKFKLNGHVFTGYDQTKSFNFETGRYDSNERIFNMISTIVSAMTDNAKERLAARLGLNIEAVGYVSNMIAQGVPLRSAVMMMLQPVVREYFQKISVTTNNIKTAAEESVFKSQIASEMMNDYANKFGEEGYTKIDLTDDLLVENIKNNGANAELQISVLQDFIGIMNQSRFYSGVAQILKLTKGLGTSFEEYDRINEKIDMLGLRIQSDKDFESYTDPMTDTPPPFDLRQIFMGYDKNKPYHNFIEGYIKIADQINEVSKGMFLERTAVFKRIQEIVRSNFKVRATLREKFENELKKDLLSYLSIKAYRKFLADRGSTGTLSTMTNGLIYDETAIQKGEKFKDIVDIMRTIREKMGDNYLANSFLNVVSTTVTNASGESAINPKNKDGINKVEANTWAKLSEYQVEKLRDSFIEIYQSDIQFDEQGRNGRDMAHALFNYLLVKDGGQFRSGSFIRYIPNFMFTDLLHSTGLANDVMKLSVTADNVEQLDEQYKRVFGLTSLDLFNEFMENYVSHIGNSYYVTRMPLDNKPQFDKTNDPDIDDFEPQSLIVTEDEDGNTKGIKINIFKGVRLKEKSISEMSLEDQAGITYLTDEDYIEYVTGLTGDEYQELIEVKKTDKKYNPKEKQRFKKSMQSLRDKGFKTNKKGEVEFPYVIKVAAPKGSGAFAGDTYFVLKSVIKADKKNKGKTQERLIEKGEVIAQGIGAYYEMFERKGSPKTFKAAGMFDAIPSVAKLPRIRRQTNNSGSYNPFYSKMNEDPEKEENWMINHGFNVPGKVSQDPQPLTKDTSINTGERTPKQILEEDYAIKMVIKSGRIEYNGDIYDMLRESLPAEEFAKIITPAQLLAALGYKAPAPDASKSLPSTIATNASVQSMGDQQVSSEKTGFTQKELKALSQIENASKGFKMEKQFDMDEEKRMRLMLDILKGGSDGNPLDDKCAK